MAEQENVINPVQVWEEMLITPQLWHHIKLEIAAMGHQKWVVCIKHHPLLDKTYLFLAVLKDCQTQKYWPIKSIVADNYEESTFMAMGNVTFDAIDQLNIGKSDVIAIITDCVCSYMSAYSAWGAKWSNPHLNIAGRDVYTVYNIEHLFFGKFKNLRQRIFRDFYNYYSVYHWIVNFKFKKSQQSLFLRKMYKLMEDAKESPVTEITMGFLNNIKVMANIIRNSQNDDETSFQWMDITELNTIHREVGNAGNELISLESYIANFLTRYKLPKN